MKEQIELRPSVRTFAEQMELVLRANDYKGGWNEDNCSVNYLERRLVEEYVEYLGNKSLEQGNNPEKECVDMANFAMMLYHRQINDGLYK